MIDTTKADAAAVDAPAPDPRQWVVAWTRPHVPSPGPIVQWSDERGAPLTEESARTLAESLAVGGYDEATTRTWWGWLSEVPHV